MSFLANIFRPPQQAQAAPQAEQAPPQRQQQQLMGETQAPRKKPARRRGGTPTKFGGVLSSTTQATEAKKTLLGE